MFVEEVIIVCRSFCSLSRSGCVHAVSPADAVVLQLLSLRVERLVRRVSLLCATGFRSSVLSENFGKVNESKSLQSALNEQVPGTLERACLSALCKKAVSRYSLRRLHVAACARAFPSNAITCHRLSLRRIPLR
ncbi:hypothetical protein TGME49_228140 [Toxoplasma gondii ME49]|uniref:Uncharacterized protein n=11 Tax=Toxoplasma gondii TaxID=5811 RepID=A0A125YQZ5_TOXGV|nr:hypothetical protein TGME49_228140 [Toxoplasma gondii ME49]EPR62344.1 hypothetical protein TGGT1_228140 [Toxoplasma gondii GT1]ESS32722.1 hypothetical protein TGVEG_228140 [Toxoplasma gondii VEG]KAF4640821.1 hypothetical protein TGRH88_047470 [Toxoplasma gondii]KFG42124.1 hypothetical protein TGP89_228140 [Toxoplasma gondii p89]KFG44975.1 hypothetical protein TGDOM2_228140 [Toxoplasma gondii GAB2-2007-GAL-DOM2]KFG52145.1 hypothetical protein TGFOU_228140 [Toxoplasma gondii FOU]KFG65662.1 |eukprot:XP_018636090.1 hypothetical protein TGME49_228140 [Toxoplasma gondii ME49]